MSDNLTEAAEAMAAEVRAITSRIEGLTERRDAITRALDLLTLLGVEVPDAKPVEAVTPRDAGKLARVSTPKPKPRPAPSVAPQSAPHPCPECGKVCGGPQGLGAHRRKVHGVVGATAPEAAKAAPTVDLDAVRALVEQADDAA